MAQEKKKSFVNKNLSYVHSGDNVSLTSESLWISSKLEDGRVTGISEALHKYLNYNLEKIILFILILKSLTSTKLT